MKEKKIIREELRSIRHYYSFVKGKCVGESIIPNDIELLVAKYNEAVKSAPIKLYEVYCCLYIEGNTIESLADKWGYTVQTVSVRNRLLVDFLQKKLVD